MVFVIQNSQNRASKAVQLKLDEVIRALDGAENKFIHLEAATEVVMAEREAEMNVIAVDVASGGPPVAVDPSAPVATAATRRPAEAPPSTSHFSRMTGGRTQAP